MTKVLMVIAPERYQDLEYERPKAVFEKAGYEVFTASTVEEANGKLGGTAKVDVQLTDVNHEDYDVVTFIGGTGVFDYFENPVAQEIATAFYNANKLTGAICAAPGILANAGLLKGKTVTCWSGEAEHMQEIGANYTGNPVERDGLIITGSGPDAATEFGEAIVIAVEG
ncbi:MAG: DJ-1/PfpI family protein [Candidatus Peregrinibacteria bacterium]|nr:DJ-1/PfpI family protein [Candidatus Peregrinibacteria bacterium]